MKRKFTEQEMMIEYLDGEWYNGFSYEEFRIMCEAERFYKEVDDDIQIKQVQEVVK